jgi:hypothetical protein
MGYLHIDNLYKNQTILMFRECYALEKIHGTSAHIQWSNDHLTLFSGGEKHDKFAALFNENDLIESFNKLGYSKIVIYGEAYGGKQQGQSWRYGKDLKFVAFDVKINDIWLAVPNAHKVSENLGFEFVHYTKGPTDLSFLDAERDAPSQQAIRNGIEGDQPREGVVLRPVIEFITNDGSRVISKHKRDQERETKTPRKVADPSKLQVLENARAIAEEWVTPTRLYHVLDKLIGQNINITRTPDVISAMIEDVLREGSLEIVDSKEARSAIGNKTALLFKQQLKNLLTGK